MGNSLGAEYVANSVVVLVLLRNPAKVKIGDSEVVVMAFSALHARLRESYGIFTPVTHWLLLARPTHPGYQSLRCPLDSESSSLIPHLKFMALAFQSTVR